MSLTLDILTTGNDRPVWLLAYNETADIAIFRASEADTAKQKKHRSLFKNDVIALPSPIQKQPIWTVAYSANNSLLIKSFLKIDSPISTEEQQILNNPASTRFDLLLHWSLVSLKTRAPDQWAKATKFENPVNHLMIVKKIYVNDGV